MIAASIAAAASLVARGASAGPPYVTDDPEPVEYKHWEVYLASIGEKDEGEGWSGFAPHVEVNYGAVPGLQLHAIVPLAYSAPDKGASAYGPGDVELGAKLRFVDETKHLPMIGTFPLVEVPVGDEKKGLGNGSAQVFVPFWIQKSFGDWTTYGGWGVWLDAGDANRHWWFFGGLLQRKLGDHLTLGAELYHTTPETAGDESDTRFNVGAIVDFTDDHHLLLSAGRSIVGPDLFQYYLAYQLTFGPRE
ncbi:MAG TPA: hypothetical protein VHB21_26750 [Minicystis sp.]|nr:hypothetical protein [Minicystis sp.]